MHTRALLGTLAVVLMVPVCLLTELDLDCFYELFLGKHVHPSCKTHIFLPSD